MDDGAGAQRKKSLFENRGREVGAPEDIKKIITEQLSYYFDTSENCQKCKYFKSKHKSKCAICTAWNNSSLKQWWQKRSQSPIQCPNDIISSLMADYETDEKVFRSESISHCQKFLSKTTKETITIMDCVIERVFEKLLKWPPSDPKLYEEKIFSEIMGTIFNIYESLKMNKELLQKGLQNKSEIMAERKAKLAAEEKAAEKAAEEKAIQVQKEILEREKIFVKRTEEAAKRAEEAAKRAAAMRKRIELEEKQHEQRQKKIKLTEETFVNRLTDSLKLRYFPEQAKWLPDFDMTLLQEFEKEKSSLQLCSGATLVDRAREATRDAVKALLAPRGAILTLTDMAVGGVSQIFDLRGTDGALMAWGSGSSHGSGNNVKLVLQCSLDENTENFTDTTYHLPISTPQTYATLNERLPAAPFVRFVVRGGAPSYINVKVSYK